MPYHGWNQNVCTVKLLHLLALLAADLIESSRRCRPEKRERPSGGRAPDAGSERDKTVTKPCVTPGFHKPLQRRGFFILK